MTLNNNVPTQGPGGGWADARSDEAATFVQPAGSPGVTPPGSTQLKAEDVAGELASAASDVGGSVKDGATEVATEVKDQARELYRQTTAELKEQAATQQKRVAEGLRTVGQQLQSMADGADQGLASDLVHQASGRASSIAEWLDVRDPGALLTDVRSYASRQPGTFIAIAAMGGIVAGRLTKSLVSNAKDAAETDTRSSAPTSPRVYPAGGAL